MLQKSLLMHLLKLRLVEDSNKTIHNSALSFHNEMKLILIFFHILSIEKASTRETIARYEGKERREGGGQIDGCDQAAES